MYKAKKLKFLQIFIEKWRYGMIKKHRNYIFFIRITIRNRESFLCNFPNLRFQHNKKHFLNNGISLCLSTLSFWGNRGYPNWPLAPFWLTLIAPKRTQLPFNTTYLIDLTQICRRGQICPQNLQMLIFLEPEPGCKFEFAHCLKVWKEIEQFGPWKDPGWPS